MACGAATFDAAEPLFQIRPTMDKAAKIAEAGPAEIAFAARIVVGCNHATSPNSPSLQVVTDSIGHWHGLCDRTHCESKVQRMIAQNVAILPPEIKAPPAQLPGGQAIGTFVNHFAAATSAKFNAPNYLSGSTALSTSLSWHKLAAKNDNATNIPSPPSNQANPPQSATPQNNQAAAVPSANANNSNNSGANTASPSGTATNAATPALAPATTTGQVQLAAALGTGTTIQLGSPAQIGSANQFTVAAGTNNNQPGTSPANASTTPTNAVPTSAAPTSVSPTQAATNQASTTAVLIAQQGVASAANAASALIPPPGLSALQSPALQAATAAANQFGPNGPTSTTTQPVGRGLTGTANQLLAAAAASTQNATQAAPNAAQAGAASATTGTGASTSTDSNPAHPGAAELNARVVAGATTLIAQSNASAVSAAKDLLQPNNANAGTLPPTSTAGTVPLDKTHTSSGIATTGSDGGLPTSATATLNGQLGELHGFTAALTRSATSSRDPMSDLPADSTKQVVAASADGGTTSPASSSMLTTTTQTNGTVDTPASAAVTDASMRSNFAAIPASEQVAIHLNQAAKNGSDEIQIQLKPASLGAIDVKLSVNHDGRLTAVISADRSDTLHLLKQDASSLQQSLRDAGFNADSSSLSFNLRSDTQSFAQNGSQQGNTTSQNAVLADDTPAKLAAYAPRQHSGTIDIQA
jgi:flagellar hook-length control protein FliK